MPTYPAIRPRSCHVHSCHALSSMSFNSSSHLIHSFMTQSHFRFRFIHSKPKDSKGFQGIPKDSKGFQRIPLVCSKFIQFKSFEATLFHMNSHWRQRTPKGSQRHNVKGHWIPTDLFGRGKGISFHIHLPHWAALIHYSVFLMHLINCHSLFQESGCHDEPSFASISCSHWCTFNDCDDLYDKSASTTDLCETNL